MSIDKTHRFLQCELRVRLVRAYCGNQSHGKTFKQIIYAKLQKNKTTKKSITESSLWAITPDIKSTPDARNKLSAQKDYQASPTVMGRIRSEGPTYQFRPTGKKEATRDMKTSNCGVESGF